MPVDDARVRCPHPIVGIMVIMRDMNSLAGDHIENRELKERTRKNLMPAPKNRQIWCQFCSGVTYVLYYILLTKKERALNIELPFRKNYNFHNN